MCVIVIQLEHRSTSMSPLLEPGSTRSDTTKPGRPMSARPLSGRLSGSQSQASDGPSSDMIDFLERLGTIDKRHQKLEERVDDLESALANKANKDEVSTSKHVLMYIIGFVPFFLFHA